VLYVVTMKKNSCYYILFIEIILNLTSKVTWLKANVAAQGFYLVRYDEDTWNELVKQLKQDKKVR